jgi:hypothetical protein
MTPTIPKHLLAHGLTTTIIYPILSIYNTSNSANNLFFSITLTMKAATSSKMSVNNYQSTCHHIPEDLNDHNKTNYEKYAQCNNSGAFTLFCSTISITVTLPGIKYWT